MSSFVIMGIALVAMFITALAQRAKLQPELILLAVGAAISFAPFIPRWQLNPHDILGIILPPILFNAAMNMSSFKFNRMRGPIISLGVFLIIVTAFAVSLVVHAFYPAMMSIPLGLVLGAAVAPPDAVSAVAIGKKLKLPDRVMTILTGESLINDAAALTLFTIAIALGFSKYEEAHAFIENPFLLFLYASGVGIALGLVIGQLVRFVRKVLREPALIALFTAIVPFAVYAGAESFHASGVLAVVSFGFVVERSNMKANFDVRISERNLWHSIDTLLNAFVFLYIGLQVSFVLSDLNAARLDTWRTLLVGLVVLGVVLGVRPIWILLYNSVRILGYKVAIRRFENFMLGDDKQLDKILSQKGGVRVRWFRRKASSSRLSPKELLIQVTHRKVELEHALRDGPLSLPEALILSWTGMRGVITLAACSAIPGATALLTPEALQAQEFQVHIFIQVVGLMVAVGTLLIQGTTLPFVIKALQKRLPESDDQRHAGQWHIARDIMEDAAMSVIHEYAEADEDLDEEQLQFAWKSFQAREIAKNKKDVSFMTRMMSDIVRRQRRSILDATANRDIHPDVASDYLKRLDYRQASIEH